MSKSGFDWLKFRIAVVVVILGFLFVLVLMRAFQVQVLEGSRLLAKANDQHVRTVKVPPERGGIYDRNLEEIAVSMEVASVYAQPPRIDDTRFSSRVVAASLSLDQDSVRKKLSSKRNFVWLKRQVDLSSEKRAELTKLSGIGIVKESRRFYPNKYMSANLVGFTGLDANGLEGVELYFEEYLRGETRKVKASRDATGRLLFYEDVEDSSKGMNVVLTIDRAIQYIAEKALSKAIESSGSIAGTAIVMDPSTGEVLAMANHPTFDANDFTSYTPAEWRNRAVTDTFEPGSVVKAFLLAAALEEGVVKPNDIIFCENGEYEVKGATFHDTKEHGWLTVSNVIKKSSNIGALKIGEKLGSVKYYEYLKYFGFGEKTGIELPGDNSGSLPHYDKWSGITRDTLSFGQGMSVTALQLVSAMSAIANKGELLKPRIVKSIVSPNGDVVEEFGVDQVVNVISEETAKEVLEILSSVTEDGGTGERAAIGGIKVAGKTATAQKPDFVKGGYKKDSYVVSFIGAVPADDPKLVIFVSLDEPGAVKESEQYISGGSIAAPAFREIAQESLSYLGVFSGNEVDGEGSSKAPAITASVKKAGKEERARIINYGMLPDFTGMSMRKVLELAKSSAVEVEFSGSGVAIKQSVEPGSSLRGLDKVSVVFQ
ncbi:MAG: transpeptidase family protein [Deltaproteobacteria bacterium]|nr:transpeptidase family protein [Deltaproteobacteria bacterium]